MTPNNNSYKRDKRANKMGASVSLTTIFGFIYVRQPTPATALNQSCLFLRAAVRATAPFRPLAGRQECLPKHLHNLLFKWTYSEQLLASYTKVCFSMNGDRLFKSRGSLKSGHGHCKTERRDSVMSLQVRQATPLRQHNSLSGREFRDEPVPSIRSRHCTIPPARLSPQSAEGEDVRRPKALAAGCPSQRLFKGASHSFRFPYVPWTRHQIECGNHRSFGPQYGNHL